MSDIPAKQRSRWYRLDQAAQIFERLAMALLLIAMIVLVLKAYSVMDSLPQSIADQLKQQGNGLSKFEDRMENQMVTLTEASAGAIAKNGDAIESLTKRAGKSFDGIDEMVAAGRDMLAHTDANVNGRAGTIPTLNADLEKVGGTLDNANAITSSLAKNLPTVERNLNVASSALATQAPPTLAHVESMAAHGDSTMAHVDATTGYLQDLGKHYHDIALATLTWPQKAAKGFYTGLTFLVKVLGLAKILGWL